MRLLTHNMLACNIRGVTNGYPLKLEVNQTETREADFNPEFLRRIFSKIEWKALREGAIAVGIEDLPEAAETENLEDEEFLRKFHRALLEVHVEEGALVCPETGRRFPISKGIPNMLLNEDEI